MAEDAVTLAFVKYSVDVFDSWGNADTFINFCKD